MAEFKELSVADQVLSLDTATDYEGQEFLLLTLHFETEAVVRIPMTVDVGMRVLALLEEVRRQRGWSMPATRVESGKIN